MNAFPNPFSGSLSFKYKIDINAGVKIVICDISGRQVQTIDQGYQTSGDYQYNLNATLILPGNYFASLYVNNELAQTIKLVKTE